MEKTAKMKKSDSVGQCSRSVGMLKGMAASYAITCIVFIAFGILLTYTNISEDRVPLVALICTAVASAIVGFDWAKCAKSRGILWGVLAGVVYVFILFILELLAGSGFMFDTAKLTMLLVAMAGGGIGGIIGINIKK